MIGDLEVILPALLVLGAILVAVWYNIRFVVRVHDGKPRIVAGKVSGPFLAQVSEICRDEHVRRGWVAGTGRGKRTLLLFSWHFHPGLRQRLRNLWAIHR